MSQYPEDKMNKEWIQYEITSDTVDWTKSFGEFLQKDEGKFKQPLSAFQIRKFFGELKRIQADPVKYKADFPLLKAKLAYAAGRNKKTKITEFYKELEKGINYVRLDNDSNAKNDITNFVKIVESIVAFHKYFEPERNNH
ncbi:MAG: type III-A CRISPR-associated protein Csm2 [bacterium]